MFRKFSNLLYLFPHLIRTAYKYAYQSNPSIEGVNFQHLESKQLDRISYYIFLNRLIIDAFAVLRNRKLSKHEIELGALLGAFTPIYDDLMDDKNYKHQELLKLSKGVGEMENVFLQMFDQLRLKHQDIETFNRYFEKAGVAQDDSITLQRNAETDIESLREIMNTKGGYFCLLFRSGLDHALSLEEETAVYQLGGLTQYVNDIFDIRKDHLDQLVTVPIKIQNKEALRVDYENAISACYQSFKNLPYHPNHFRKFFLQIHLMLSRGFVALDQYQAVAKQKPFIIASLSRSELVCDMEKPIHVIKNLRYTIDLEALEGISRTPSS